MDEHARQTPDDAGATALLGRIDRPGPKKMLCIDGGGIRGHIAIELIAGIEDVLRGRSSRPDAFVLADYFDFFSGTSTGAIIAAALATGMRASDVRALYDAHGEAMFTRNPWYRRLGAKYSERRLAEVLKEIFGEHTTLGDPLLKTLLMVVARNANTGSPWPLTNNPRAMFNLRVNEDGTPNEMCNLDIPLWMLIRASTAAPGYFRPETISLGGRDFSFVDGGLTPYNNPSFQTFLTATHPAYRVNWKTGAKNLLLVSVGTGSKACEIDSRRVNRMNLLDHAREVPAALLQAIKEQQDMLCRVFGDCLFGDPIDLELGSLNSGEPSLENVSKLFTYCRLDVELSAKSLQRLGLPGLDVNRLCQLDSIRHVAELKRIGERVRQADVAPRLFEDFPVED
ncbi:patatin-like phospholipase family protein [Fundidesulfovibrio agrisoli]|uniref:patatin-like phospholipase family protein n=1 Tax=Fundidesulfovibrio agrisoli TaxID=2922717 RepID=UPI001FABDB6E|nr:patatin-like phospholipase family protein [Fundidesulfovibrio agrisoli]